MEKQTMDRRQRKTRQAIYSAFESLMAHEHYRSITVAQIIERADIGRSTFYAHFETKDDLLDQMCLEIFEHIFEGVNEHCTTHADLQAVGLGGVLTHLLYHLRDTHGAICGKLLTEGEPHFTTYFRNELAVLFSRKVDAFPEGVPADYAIGLLVASFCQTVVWWFEAGAAETPETLTSWFLSTLKID